MDRRDRVAGRMLPCIGHTRPSSYPLTHCPIRTIIPTSQLGKSRLREMRDSKLMLRVVLRGKCRFWIRGQISERGKY